MFLSVALAMPDCCCNLDPYTPQFVFIGEFFVYSSLLKLDQFDPELFLAISQEARRQEDHIELIASENYASPCVMAAQGSVLTNKYAEGYPSKRYYGGCEYVDIAENLAIERAKILFKADYANVQPHSGSQANAAVLMALCQPGDVILGMNLSEGGHLTHGASVNFSGKLFKAFQYGISHETGLIDYEQVRELAKKNKPKVIIAGFSAYSRIVDWQIFREIADEVGAYLMVDMAHVAGLVAAGVYPSPVQIADVVTSTTHKTLRGPRGGLILAKKNEELFKKFNTLVFPGTQGGPLMHVIAAKAVSFKEARMPEFISYQKQVILNARTMAECLVQSGFNIISGGTDNHLLLVSLLNNKLTENITGKEAEMALGSAFITVNKNTVPNDPRSPFVTSGLRLGTPAVTTRGFKEKEIKLISSWIANIIQNPQDTQKINQIRKQVCELCAEFPVYVN